MRITVKVKTRAREEKVEQIDAKTFKVAVTVTPVDGKANKAVIKALARYFDIPQSGCTLATGHTAPTKIFDIALKS